MNYKEKCKKKCAFYVSEYHCDLIILKYVNEKIDKEVIVFNENCQEEKIAKIISTLNFSENSKKKLLNLNWNNDNVKKVEKLKNEIDDEKDLAIFIQGSEEYIKSMNENIKNNIIEYNNLDIIDCYEFSEVSFKLNNIVDCYTETLNINIG